MKVNLRKGNSVIGFIIIIAIIWSVSSLFSDEKPESSTYKQNTYNSASVSSYDDSASVNSDSYQESENPYSEGTGHSAGYEWAKENNVTSCDGNSDSFIEGCEEYLSQQEESNLAN